MQRSGRILLIVFLMLGLSAPADAQSQADTVRVKIDTTMGDIVVDLDRARAPASVENFLKYMSAGHYDRTLIHRVVSGYVVQGGGYSKYLKRRGTRAPVVYEGDNGLKNFRGRIAMARGDHPDSADSQWFINLQDNPDLDHKIFEGAPLYGYTVFGVVAEGMDIVDQIGGVSTGPGGEFDAEVPLEQIIVNRIDIIE